MVRAYYVRLGAPLRWIATNAGVEGTEPTVSEIPEEEKEAAHGGGMY